MPSDAFRYSLPLGSAFGSEKSSTKKTELMKSKSPRNQTISRTFGTPWGIRTPGLLVRRLSHAQTGAVSAPICAFYHRSLGGFSIVSAQPCPPQFHSGSKLGQTRCARTHSNSVSSSIAPEATARPTSTTSSFVQSSRIPLTSRAELIYDWERKSGQKTVRTFLI